MAALGSLVVSLEANMARFTSDMGRAAQMTEQAMQKMNASSAQTQQAMQRLDSSVAVIKNSIAGLAAVASIGAFKALSDSASMVEGKIRLVTDSYAELKAVQAEVLAVSQKTRQSFESTADLYTKVFRASENLNLSQKDLIKFTGAVNNAMTVSAAGAQQSEAAILQLGQAMASGKLSGDEFKSISENAPRLVQAIADGMGVARGQMKQLSTDGKLTAEVITQAVISQFGVMEAEAAKMPVTIGQSFQQLRNTMVDYMVGINESSGITEALAGAVGVFSKNIKTLEAGVAGLVSYKVAGWAIEISTALISKANAAYTAAGALSTERFAAIASAEANAAKTATDLAATQAKMAYIVTLRADAVATLASANATVQATAAMGAHSAALAMNAAALQARSVATAELAALGRAQVAVDAAMTAATASATAAQTALTAAKVAGAGAANVATRALGLLGGPIGLITTALGLGVTAWMLWGNSAKGSEEKAAGAIGSSTEDILADLDKQIKKLQERNAMAGAGLKAIAQSSSPEAGRMVSLKAQMDAVSAGTGDYAGLNDIAKNDILAKLGAQYGTLYAKIQTVTTEKAKLESSDDASKLDAWLVKYATKAEKLAAELKKAKEELGGAFTPEIESRIRGQFEEKAHKSATPKKTDEQRIAEDAARFVAKLKEEAEAYGKSGAALLEYQLAQSKMPQQYKDEAMALQVRIDALKASDEANKKLVDEQKQAAAEADRASKQNNANVENIRIGLMTELEQETLAHELRLKSLQNYHDEKLENVADANALIEAENARHEKTKADLQASYALQGLSMAGSSADQLYNLMQKAGMEQTALGKAVFLASKAIAVAEIIMNTEVAASKASAMFPVWGTAIAMGIRAAGYASAGLVAGMAIADVSGAREKGGPVWGGGAFLVGEKGPEIFQPSGHGTIIPNSQIGGAGGEMKLTIVNNTRSPIGQVTEQRISPTERALIIQEAVSATAAQFGDPNSSTSRALSRNYATQRSR